MIGVSVVVALRNASSVLPRCLKSIAAQRGVDLQPIFIDGGSSDGTVELLQAQQEWIEAHDGYLSSAPDRGIYDAWNKALPYVRREWVLFLGADDAFWDRDALCRLASGCAQADAIGAGLVYGRVGLFDAAELIAILGRPWADVVERRFDKMPFPHPGVLHRRSMFDRVGGFDPNFRIAGDFEWFCRALANETPIFAADAIVVAMSLGGMSSNPRNVLLAAIENDKARRQNGVGNVKSLWGKTVDVAARSMPSLLPASWTRRLIRRYYRQESPRLPAQLPSPEWPPSVVLSPVSADLCNH